MAVFHLLCTPSVESQIIFGSYDDSDIVSILPDVEHMPVSEPLLD